MKVDAWLWSGSSLGLVVMTMKTGMINEQHATVLDLYERYRDDEMFLTGAFGGVKIFIHPIKGADPDDRCWRMYFAPRVQDVEKDRAYPTKATRAAPPGWAGVRERQSMTKSLAAIGMGFRFDQDAQRELGLLEDDPDER